MLSGTDDHPFCRISYQFQLTEKVVVKKTSTNQIASVCFMIKTISTLSNYCLHAENDSFNITWNIALSSRFPGKGIIGFPFVESSAYRNYNMTDLEDGQLKLLHSMAEFNRTFKVRFFYLSALLDDTVLQRQFTDKNPTRTVTQSLDTSYTLPGKYSKNNPIRNLTGKYSTILNFIQALLVLHYWYSHAAESTVGISIIGTAFIASGNLLRYAANHFIWIVNEPTRFWELVRLLGYSTIFNLDSFVMLKAITRVEITWFKRRWIVIPVGLRFASATHAERASMRLEARTPWREKLLVRSVLTPIVCNVANPF